MIAGIATIIGVDSKGSTDSMTLSIKINIPLLEKWLYILTKFGIYSSKGSQRTAGIDHYIINKVI
jgi:hypothetical protein